MLDIFKKLVGFLTLVDDTRPAAQRTWRWMITFSIILLSVHVAIACNLLTFAGVHGFAMAGDLDATRTTISEVQIQQIETVIFETRVKQCNALKQSQPAFAYAQKVQDMLGRYAYLTNRDYQLPQCSDL